MKNKRNTGQGVCEGGKNTKQTKYHWSWTGLLLKQKHGWMISQESVFFYHLCYCGGGVGVHLSMPNDLYIIFYFYNSNFNRTTTKKWFVYFFVYL